MKPFRVVITVAVFFLLATAVACSEGPEPTPEPTVAPTAIETAELTAAPEVAETLTPEPTVETVTPNPFYLPMYRNMFYSFRFDSVGSELYHEILMEWDSRGIMTSAEQDDCIAIDSDSMKDAIELWCTPGLLFLAPKVVYDEINSGLGTFSEDAMGIMPISQVEMLQITKVYEWAPGFDTYTLYEGEFLFVELDEKEVEFNIRYEEGVLYTTPNCTYEVGSPLLVCNYQTVANISFANSSVTVTVIP